MGHQPSVGKLSERQIIGASLVHFGPWFKIALIPPSVGLQCSRTGFYRGFVALGADSMRDVQGVGLGDTLHPQGSLATHLPSVVTCQSGTEIREFFQVKHLHKGEQARKEETGPGTRLGPQGTNKIINYGWWVGRFFIEEKEGTLRHPSSVRP